VARTHEVPNHLNVEDTLFLGLTARQVATFMAFASPAYGIWDQLTVAPTPVRGALAGLLLLVGIGFALVQPGHRPLDEWVFAILAHARLRGGCAGAERSLIQASGAWSPLRAGRT